MSVINTNVNSLLTQASMNANNRSMANAMSQLSTGLRINSAKDDAAGLAISQNMTMQIRGLDQAVRNANDAIGLLQTAEGAMIEQSNLLQRMRELAIQASNDTTSNTQKQYLNKEFDELRKEINRIGTNTEWNSETILAGSSKLAGGTLANNSQFKFQVGANKDQTIEIDIKRMAFTSGGANGSIGALNTKDSTTAVAGDTAGSLNVLTLNSTASAQNAIAATGHAINVISDQRATIGAVINRLTFAIDNLTNVSMNSSASRSQIMDTDYAAATTELTRTQIIQQAAVAMLAQANQQPAQVLALLQ